MNIVTNTKHFKNKSMPICETLKKKKKAKIFPKQKTITDVPLVARNNIVDQKTKNKNKPKPYKTKTKNQNGT